MEKCVHSRTIISKRRKRSRIRITGMKLCAVQLWANVYPGSALTPWPLTSTYRVSVYADILYPLFWQQDTEIAVLVPDIIKVTHGPEAGKTWLCDKYVNGTFKKYSGTNEAGDGKDLFSKAVNAFAHYVAEQSEWSIVPTDIQGMTKNVIIRAGWRTGIGQLEDCISNGLVQSRKLFLYDIQFHT